jgi:hypothetical protein
MKLQQKLLSRIQAYECLDTFVLTVLAFKHVPGVVEPGRLRVTDAQLASVHRALSGLAKQGLIVRLSRRFSDGRTRWCTPGFAAEHPDGTGLPRSDRALADESRAGPKRVFTRIGVERIDGPQIQTANGAVIALP